MPQSCSTLEELLAKIRRFVEERDWTRYQRPVPLTMSVAIELGELFELFQWLSEDEVEEHLKSEAYRQALRDEFADVMIYLLRLADVLGISPTDAVLDKLGKNAEKYPKERWSGKIPSKT
ncbi:MAG: nucleotide pyrophosphohydrolase [Candidatus Thorarchaeota archaeon]|nr:MAG: nucleotide pyrophosphohydrolase [Candidatus Thorarchaeota archaeon]